MTEQVSPYIFSAVTVSFQTSRPFNALALLLLPFLCAVGLIGNAFVCVAIATDRRLHNVTNYFLFSLALADLLVCCIVMPLSIVVEVRHGVWTWNFSLCLLYVYSDVFLCSASIVHMSVISLDRYLGISQPLKTRNKSKTMIIVKITLVWVITVLISSPLAVAAIQDPTNVLRNNSCMIFNRYYMVYGSTLSFLIPFLIMAVTYVKTTGLLKKQAKILSEKATDGVNGEGLRRTMVHRKLGYCRTNSAIMGNGSVLKKNGHSPLAHCQSVGEAEMERLIKKSTVAVQKQSTIERWKSRTSSCLQAIATRVTKRNSLQSASQELANEHKATRVLAVVFICFFFCWTPFFIANFLLGFCGEKCALPTWAGSLFLWLGYVSSTINPLIYTVFNKRFRQAFVRIVRCQCFTSFRDPYSFYSRHTTMLPDTYYTCSNAERATSRDENGNAISRREGRDQNNELITRKTSSTPLRAGNRSISECGPQTPTRQHLPPPLNRQHALVKRSLTTLLPSNGSTPAVQQSLANFEKRRMSDSMESGETSSSSAAATFVLFSSVLNRPVRETFL